MRAECMLVLHELPPLRIPKVLCIDCVVQCVCVCVCVRWKLSVTLIPMPVFCCKGRGPLLLAKQ